MIAAGIAILAYAATAVSDPLASEDGNKWIYGPEIWRLPPVNPPPTNSNSPFVQPQMTAIPPSPAFTVPPAEMIAPPKPVEKPPVTNSPISLSGVLSNGVQLPAKPEPVKLWDGSFNLGLDGSEGNSEAFNFRCAAALNRKTSMHALTTSFDYLRSTANTVATAHSASLVARSEWLLSNASRWSWFINETVDYDEFNSYRLQDATAIGLGYRIVKSEITTLIGRFGVGFSHDYGGPEDGVVTPEAVFGLQLEHRIGKRQKFLGAVDYAPGIEDYRHYRIRAQAAWELLLDQDKNLSMRMGVIERYNSVADEDSRPNDVNYAMMLMWKF